MAPSASSLGSLPQPVLANSAFSSFANANVRLIQAHAGRYRKGGHDITGLLQQRSRVTNLAGKLQAKHSSDKELTFASRSSRVAGSNMRDIAASECSHVLSRRRKLPPLQPIATVS